MKNKLAVLVSFSGLANFLGTMGIIGSLIFVGIEVRQTQTIAIAGQIQERAKMETDRLLSYTEGNLDGQKLWSVNNLNIDELSEDELVVARLGHSWRGIMLQNNYYQYSVGLFDERYWPQQERRIAGWYNNCDFRPPLSGYIEGFQDYLSSIAIECLD
jgi:hypothetical protein